MSHNPMDRSITAFTLDDLGVQHTGHGTTFVAPPTPSVDLIVQDNDGYLSGDRFGNARDRTEQTADINRFGVDTGNDRQIYADRAIVLRGDDHQTYILIEIDQERANTPVYTYFADVPPAGTELTVIGSFNVHGSLPYARLGAGDAPQNIVDIAAGSSDFDLLVKALAAADLVNTVKDLTDVTVFAPTDAAFTQLAVDLGFTGDTTDEDAVFNAIVDALTALAPDGNPIPLLTDVLLYHVSAGAKTAAQIDAADKVATLLPGATFETSGTELIDNEPDVDNPSIVIPDIVAANGRIQALDRVLLPIDIPGNTAQPTQTLAEIVGDSGGVFDTDGEDFDILLTSLGAADLVTALDDPAASLTGFLPTDDAFIATAQALGFEGSGEADAFGYIVNALTLLSGGEDPIPLLRDILLYHVAPTALDSGAVLGARISVWINSGSRRSGSPSTRARP
ncbi:MAG: fasciclin domain-containing protein, partial [Pseudomonadota bacterium]